MALAGAVKATEVRLAEEEANSSRQRRSAARRLPWDEEASLGRRESCYQRRGIADMARYRVQVEFSIFDTLLNVRASLRELEEEILRFAQNLLTN